MPEKRSDTPPSHLSAAAKRWWKCVVSEYRLEEHHLRLLTAAAEAWDRMNEARALVDRDGIVDRDRFGQKRTHPCVAVERDSRLAFARLLRELNLDSDVVPDPSLRRS